LESFGRLFKNALKLYVYPVQDPVTGSLTTARNLAVAHHLKHLYAYLLENELIEDICQYDRSYLPIFSKDVIAKIQTADPHWEQMVPEQVARMIKERGLFGYGR